jgi:hypothetical protein
VSPVIVLDAWRLVRPGRDFAIVDRRDRVQRNGRQACEQVDDGSRTLTVNRPACVAVANARTARRARSRARVKTRGRRHGRWRVEGKYSIGASEGTDWTTFEACSSTTTVVRRGRVRVRDRVRRRTVIVRAGQSYTARRRGTLAVEASARRR